MQTEPKPAHVREHLAKILASTVFAQAPVLSRLLQYLADQTLTGKASELKESVVGMEVFHRGASFDARTDTIVRVQARRLRTRLDEYYRGPGQGDPIRVLLPKGHYALQFETVSDRRSFAELKLPLPHTRLIGREQELAAICELVLSDSSWMLTLTGAGGSGKTRLAVQAAAHLLARFPGGVYFAAMAPVTDPVIVTSTLAQLFGVRHTGSKPLTEALRDYLRATLEAPTLLLIDNFEQVLAAAPILATVLEASAFLKILVTSRARLHVHGEREYPVLPLLTPDPENLPSLEQLRDNPAVQLFVERATALDPAFALCEANALAVSQICFRVDGLPLAIELAAVRAKVLAPAAIMARLDNRLDLLTQGPQDAPARQRTLRATIEWSHELLREAEQKLFRRLAVFAGGCTLESAEAVFCNTRRDLVVDALGGLSSLADKSLLNVTKSADAETRFLMLETIREYALERLAQNGEEEATRRAHAAYCIVLAEERPYFGAVEHEIWLALRTGA